MSTGEIIVMIVVLCLAPLVPALCCLLCWLLLDKWPVKTSAESDREKEPSALTGQTGCSYCGGSGYYEAYSSLSGEGGSWSEPCPFCNTTGSDLSVLNTTGSDLSVLQSVQNLPETRIV